nr:uncharacterized protein LOC106682271 isoform X2 [Halyomorpha halys]
MKFLYAAIFVLIGLYNIVRGASVMVVNNKVFVDGRAVDLNTLPVVKETPAYVTYQLHSGDSIITITKSKFGNALSINSIGQMSKEQKEQMETLHEQMRQNVANNINQVQHRINAFNQQLNENMSFMQKKMQNLFNTRFFPFF